jgi:hypothetical protein
MGDVLDSMLDLMRYTIRSSNSIEHLANTVDRSCSLQKYGNQHGHCERYNTIGYIYNASLMSTGGYRQPESRRISTDYWEFVQNMRTTY